MTSSTQPGGPVVLAIDGSPASIAAASWAAAVATALDVAVIAIAVVEHSLAEVAPSVAEDVRNALARRVVQVCDDVGLAATGRTVVVLDAGGARRGPLLVETARHRGAALLVVGTEGHRGPLGSHLGLHLGSVANHLVRHATMPLLVVPVDGRVPPGVHGLPTSVVGVDGSSPAHAAVAFLARLAAPTGADVVAVSVRGPVPEWVPHADARSWYRGAADELRTWTEPLRAAGVAVVEQIVEHAHPAEALAAVVRESGAGLVAVGVSPVRHGVGLRLGGTATRMLRGATTAVLLVPPTDEGPPL